MEKKTFSLDVDETWGIKEAKQARDDLDTNGMITFVDNHNADLLTTLDEHLFKERDDVLLFTVSHLNNDGYSDNFLKTISGMKYLKRLFFNVEFKQDLSVLVGLGNLVDFRIATEIPIDIDFLCGIKNLNTLSLTCDARSKGAIKSFDPISFCKKLKTLYLYNHRKVDFDFAKDLKIDNLLLYKIRGYLNEAYIFTITLKIITLMDLPLEELSLLSDCKSLERIILKDMKKIVDAKKMAKALIDMPALKELSAQDIGSDKQYKDIRKIFEEADKSGILK
jgi:hypothetical protein